MIIVRSRLPSSCSVFGQPRLENVTRQDTDQSVAGTTLSDEIRVPNGMGIWNMNLTAGSWVSIATVGNCSVNVAWFPDFIDQWDWPLTDVQ